MNENFLHHLESLTGVVTQYGLDLVAGIAILFFGWWVAGRVRSIALRSLNKVPVVDDTLKPFFASIARYAVLAITLIAVLAQLGIQTTSIIAVLGAAGLAIGLALQGTLQNIAAGIMLLILRPLKVGDYIDAGGTAGTVDEIGLFTTDMTTYDGVYLSVPNSALWNTSILNYSRLPTRRMDVPVGIAYEDDVEAAIDLLLSHLRSDERVLVTPAPQVMVTGLGASSVDLNLRCWSARENFWALKFDLNKNTKLWLDTAGISIPFPQRDVHLISSSAENKSAG